jgi:hypothetical protein
VFSVSSHCLQDADNGCKLGSSGLGAAYVEAFLDAGFVHSFFS